MKNRLASAAPFIMAALLARPALAQTPYSHGDPTADEQLVLEIINRARANPAAEGTRLGISITEGLTAPEAALVGPRPPLAMNSKLLAAARLHTQDMINRAFFDHFSPAPVTSPSDRVDAQGYVWQRVGENIAVRTAGTAAQLEDDLMIDAGVPGRGHRKNLLDINSGPYYREIGAAYLHTVAGVFINIPPAATWHDFVTQDFGRQQSGQPIPGPFLVGVVRNDANGNDFYDLGEGMSGVTITIAGNAYSAVSSTTGGFAIPLSVGGTLVVTATGGGLPGPVTKSIATTGENIKLDFELQDIADTDLDGMPDNWETANGLNPAVNDAAGDADSDGFTNLEEYQGSSNPQSNASVPPGDKDGDGMPNPWEVANGLNPLSGADAALDADADGFTNLEEYQGGGDPQSSASAPAGDKDGDGMPNPWEVQYQLDPFVNDAYGDADGDSVANLVEYQSGSNPRDPNSVPKEEEDDSICGCTGLELFAPLALAWIGRRRRRSI